MPNKLKEAKSALFVNKGIEHLPVISDEYLTNFKLKNRRMFTAEKFTKGILSHNRTILSQAITLIESRLPKHQKTAQQVIESCIPYRGKSIRIGITGVPGVGKSSFIEAIGLYIVSKGHKLAVLTIDPSSERSGGSILADKTRMERLANHPDAFIRPSPASGSLGGVARKTREAIYLCEAGGFDIIFVETVGVGQSETEVHSMVDFFLLLMLTGAGDELQGIKRGIIEMADAIVITKADGNNIEKANQVKLQFQSSLSFFPIAESGWAPKVLTCSSHDNKGIDDVWEVINEYINLVKSNGYFELSRIEQSKYWMHHTIRESLSGHFYENHHIKNKLQQLEKDLIAGNISSFDAANQLLLEYFKIMKK